MLRRLIYRRSRQWAKELRQVRSANLSLYAPEVDSGSSSVSVTDPNDIATLVSLLAIGRAKSGMCLCGGTVSITLLDDAREAVAVASVHHGKTLRNNDWRSDARLVNGPGLTQWLRAHGVPT